MIVDQSSGICDQSNKPKHVILPNFNKSRKCLSFEKVRERKSTTLLTDVTLADEDINSIPTDDVNGQSQAM